MTSITKPLNIIICGGSVAGLVSGILLKRRGHNITILEQSHSSTRSGLAAGIGLSYDIKRFFEEEDRCKDLPLGVLNPGFTVLDDDLNAKYELPIAMNLTTWDAVYYRCRANFDGFASSYVPNPPEINADGTEGVGEYVTGKKVLKIEDPNGRLVVLVEDTETMKIETYEPDLVIGADGANSTLRRQLQPHIRREEPGYVIWRGTIPTKELSREVLDKIENKPVIWPGPKTYCVIYTIPGKDGSLAQGERHINFAWYFWPDKASLTDIMTDTDGHVHRTTIPKGKMRPEIWQPQIEQARRLLPKELVALVERIEHPFVSVIASFTSPKAAYFDNRVFLVGEALTQAQPNTGQGTTLVAFAAMTLVNEVIAPPPDDDSGPDPLHPDRVAAWEHKVLEETAVARLTSISFASWYLNSWPMIAYYYARTNIKAYVQYWMGTRRTVYTAMRKK